MTIPVKGGEKRILHVITVLSVGGAEMWLIELLRHLQSLDENNVEHESFEILLTGGQPHDLDVLARSLGATLHYIRFSRTRFPQFTRQFRKLLRTRKYSAIHDHQDYAAGWHLLAGAGTLPPVRIVHVHNAHARLAEASRTLFRRWLIAMSRVSIRNLSTHILGTSNDILAQYEFTPERFPNQVVRCLHCGFDTARFAEDHARARVAVCEEFGWPPDSRIVLFVGRLDAFKNADFAIDVARTAMEGGCDMRFLMVGGGEDARARLEHDVEAAGYSSRIRLTGRRLDVPRLMSASHCFLFPSLQEGLGMVAVEAQAAGVRVIASDAVSREVVVVPGLVEFLPLSAGVSAWSEVLCRALDMPRADTADSNARVESSSFSIGSSYNALHSIYAG